MSFFEFNIGVSGLYAAQRGLSVTANNLANATTEGYSRQVLRQEASKALSGIGVGMLGTGVTTTGIERIRDSYLDLKLWKQNASLGEYTIKTTQNSLVESVFGEPSDAGFTEVINSLYSAFDNLSMDPTQPERKAALKQSVISFCKYFNNISESLSGFQQDLNFEVKNKVDEINMLSAKVASLNQQIYQSELYGDDANSLRDQRELCVDRLSELINIEAKEVELIGVDGQVRKEFTIKAAGQTLVSHLTYRELGVSVRGEKEQKINDLSTQIADLTKAINAGDTSLVAQRDQKISELKKISNKVVENNGPPYQVTVDGNVVVDNETAMMLPTKWNSQDKEGLYNVIWKDGLPFDMSDQNMSGELKGAIDMRDGCGTGANVEYNGIPYYIKRLDSFVQQFAKTMNDIYNTGNTGVPYYLFTYTDGNTAGAPEKDLGNPPDYTKITAANFSIALDIYQDSSKIRTNLEDDPLGYISGTPSNPNPSNNDLLLELLAQKTNTKMFKEGDPKDYMISIFSELGINTQEATMYQKTQTSVTNSIKNQRREVSEPDVNEEFINLIKYQQAYQAAAKIISTLDGIYETTIFRLGSF